MQLRKESAHQSIVSVSFMSEDTILIPHGDRHCLELCTLSKCPERGRVLHTALYLELPPLAPYTELGTCSVVRDTSSFTPADCGSTNTAPLFSAAISESICAVRMILDRREDADMSFHSFLLVSRCATLDKLASHVPVDERYEWPEPNKQYLSLDGQWTTRSDGLASPPSPDYPESKAYILGPDFWLRERFAWLDAGDIGATTGERSWSVHGQRLLGWSGMDEESGPALPLRILDFNAYNARSAAALVKSMSKAAPGNSSAGNEQEEETEADSEFGPWTGLHTGYQLAVADRHHTVPAGHWWKHDLVSNMPFTVTQAVEAEHWPLLIVHGNLILRSKGDWQQNVSDARLT